jgi:hypothetical protein
MVGLLRVVSSPFSSFWINIRFRLPFEQTGGTTPGKTWNVGIEAIGDWRLRQCIVVNGEQQKYAEVGDATVTDGVHPLIHALQMAHINLLDSITRGQMSLARSQLQFMAFTDPKP